MMAPPIRNAMTVDVEDWFQVQNYAGLIGRDAWETLERRVEARTDELLALFAAAGVRATFFTLGWVARRHGPLVRRIVGAGHELASHGNWHELVSGIGAARFRADLADARHLLEDAGGVAVIGYRAPTFSISPSLTPWAYDILAETGHRYSSSVFPGRHAGAADAGPDAGIGPCWPGPNRQPGPVHEIPITVLRTPLRHLPLLRQVPVAGGGPFRMTPHPLFTAGLRRVNALGRRGVFYLHPWEIDPGQPRVPGTPLLTRLKHFTGLGRMKPRLARLLGDFAWDRMDAVFAAELAQSARQSAPQPLAAA